jgi:hypothetical protein
MVKVADKVAGWELPRRKPITRTVIDRAIAAEDIAVQREHRAREAWFDPRMMWWRWC